MTVRQRLTEEEMAPFSSASVQSALRADFAEYIALDEVTVRETRPPRRDGLIDALRLIFGRTYRRPGNDPGQWPVLIPPL